MFTCALRFAKSIKDDPNVYVGLMMHITTGKHFDPSEEITMH